MVKGNYSVFFRKPLDCTVISTLCCHFDVVLSFRPTGEIFKRWRMNKGLRFLAMLGMTKDAEKLRLKLLKQYK